MTFDEKRLLKRGLFWALVLAGFWLLIASIHHRVVSLIAMLVWLAFLFAVFYRDAQKEKPN